MSDTNDTWSEAFSRTEIQELYGITITEMEWDVIREKLDGAIADVFFEVMNIYDVG